MKLCGYVRVYGVLSRINFMAISSTSLEDYLFNGVWLACKNLSKYYPIVMKCLVSLPLYEDTSAVHFGPDRAIRLQDKLAY